MLKEPDVPGALIRPVTCLLMPVGKLAAGINREGVAPPVAAKACE
jgi:hypothetical protein